MSAPELKPLSKNELQWLKRINKILKDKPIEAMRLGFRTIHGESLVVFDKDARDEYEQSLPYGAIESLLKCLPEYRHKSEFDLDFIVELKTETGVE